MPSSSSTTAVGATAPPPDENTKRQAAREVIDILHEIAVLLVRFFPIFTPLFHLILALSLPSYPRFFISAFETSSMCEAKERVVPLEKKGLPHFLKRKECIEKYKDVKPHGIPHRVGERKKDECRGQ